MKVTEVSKDAIVLAWKQPENNGCSHITNYVVEKKECGRKAWQQVTDNCGRTTWRVPCMAGGQYVFRVMAENDQGVGVPAETPNAIVATEVPQPVEAVMLKDVTKDSISIRWGRPLCDGGTKISSYIIETRDKDKKQWIKRLERDSRDTTATIKGLTENIQVSLRVIAVNHAGKSAPREYHQMIMVRDTQELSLIHI